MSDLELRLECLRLAVQFGSARTAADPAELAGRYVAFVNAGNEAAKTAKPRTTRKAKAA